MYDKHREDANAGEMITDHGTVRFAEDFDGEYFYFDVYDSVLQETKRIMLSPSEIHAIAKVGVLVEAFEPESLGADTDEISRNMRTREKELQRIRDIYENSMPLDLEEDYDSVHADLPGGDGTPEYYAVEGWGTIKLSNGDFEVSYKV